MERLSTNMIFSMMTSQISDNQKEIVNLTKQINESKNFTTSYDNPVAFIGSVATGGRILENNQTLRDLDLSISELEVAETPLRTMKDIMDRINEIALRASNGSTSADERVIFKNELRTLGESVVQLSNSKVGDKYIFSGQQSSFQTIRLDTGADFKTAIYKHNQDDTKERFINGQPTSISLKEVLLAEPEGASMTSTAINPVVQSNGDLVMEVDDGNGNKTQFSTSLASGDDLSTVITKINAAFTTAGGLGTIAQESPLGYLNFNTNLVTGNSKNSKAMISIDKSSSSEITDVLYLKKQKIYGSEMGILNTLSDLESALSSNDEGSIRDLLGNINFNITQLNSKISNVGLLMSQAQSFKLSAEDLNIKLESDLSAIQDLDFISASLELNNAQSALQTAIRTSSNFFSFSLSNFLG